VILAKAKHWGRHPPAIGVGHVFHKRAQFAFKLEFRSSTTIHMSAKAEWFRSRW
jgi:hypothetical protein